MQPGTAHLLSSFCQLLGGRLCGHELGLVCHCCCCLVPLCIQQLLLQLLHPALQLPHLLLCGLRQLLLLLQLLLQHRRCMLLLLLELVELLLVDGSLL
jgi:hypothetical protein